MRFMKFNITAFVRLALCGIYLASLGLHSLSLQAHAEEVLYLQDGWMLLNPARIVNQNKTWEGLWTLDVKTRPLFNDLSPKADPMAQILNHYYDVRFTPDPTLFEFTGDVTQYGEKHTPHFIKDDLKTNATHRLAELQKETSQGQQFKDGLNTFGSTIVWSPIALLFFPLSPYIIDNEITQPARERKEALTRKKRDLDFLENQLYLSQMAEALLPRLQALDALQQDYTDPSKNKALLSYHVLPTTKDYSVNRVKRTLLHGIESELLSFGLKLKQDIPLKTFRTLLSKEFKLNPNNAFYFTTPIWKETSNLLLDKQDYVTDCTLYSRQNFESFRLECNGYLFYYKKGRP
ncbi:MAG: hypothetical protein HEQ32_05370 [Vampirovibrio sp.]